MAAGAYVAVSSEQEVARTERRRARFLGTAASSVAAADRAWVSALFVGASYFAGALVPVLPVLLGARSALASLIAAGAMIVAGSLGVPCLFRLDVRPRVVNHLGIIAAALGVNHS